MRRLIVSSILALLVSYFVGQYLFHVHAEPHGPNSSNIKAHTYHDNKLGCYKMIPVPYVCPFAH